jgi:GT2 family glycosyltransferase
MIRTAIVILNWNGEEFLQKFLPGVIDKSVNTNTKIVIADNGSTDHSISFLQKNFPGIDLIQFDKNYGFTEGYNKALAKVEAEYFILLNSDIEVTHNWVDPLIEVLEKDTKIAVVMPKIRSYSDPGLFEYAGAAGGFIDKFGYPFCRGRMLNNIEKDKGQYDTETEIFWATGACMAIKAETFRNSGGFDTYMFAHMEEIDLCWRLKNQGYKIMFTPKSVVYHVGGGSLPNEHPRKLYYNFRNNLILLYKNLPKGKLYPILITRLILDGIAALKFLLGFKFSYVAAVARAHFRFYTVASSYHKYRKKHGPKTREFPDQIFRKSMLIRFYFKKKRKFSELNTRFFISSGRKL